MNYSNNAYSVLDGAITSAATAIQLAAGTGSRFPASDFRATLVSYDANGNESAWEIVHCSSRAGDVLTVARGQEGTPAAAWASGARIENRITAGSMATLEPAITPGTTAQYLRGDKTWQSLNKSAVGLGNVDNTSDANKPVSTATQTALNLKANLESPTFTGVTTFPSSWGMFTIQPGTGDGASTTVYNTTIKSWWGIGFRDYTDSATVKAYIDCRSGVFAGQQLTSLIETGTAPLVVASTTAVDNLNADLLDGQHGSFYQNASNLTTGIVPEARLPGRLREVAAVIADWNDAQSNGWYMAHNAANAPVSSTWFMGSVENHWSGGWCTQVVHAFGNDSEYDTQTYRRERNDGVWGTWQRCRITEAEQVAVTQAWWNNTAVPISKVTGLQSALDGKAQTATPTITGLREVRAALPANNIDLATGNVFTKTISGATTLTVSNVPAAGTAASFILDLTNGGSAAITWWSGVKWAGGTVPTLTAAGRDVLGFFTHDGGTTWTGLVLGKDVK